MSQLVAKKHKLLGLDIGEGDPRQMAPWRRTQDILMLGPLFFNKSHGSSGMNCFRFNIVYSGVVPANQTKESEVRELLGKRVRDLVPEPPSSL